MSKSLSEMIVSAILDQRERDRYRGRTDWEARQFIKRQYESGKTNFHEVFDFYSIFTPIELEIWKEIAKYQLPFLPQYPVLRYFADFADPKKRIVIECDGKQHDEAADKNRDRDMEDHGWTVYRIKGADCFQNAGTSVVLEIAKKYYELYNNPTWTASRESHKGEEADNKMAAMFEG